MKKRSISILVGLLIIGCGVFYAGTVLGLWDISIRFDGWWTLFIILPCLLSMGTSGINLLNCIGTGVGILLLLDAQRVFQNHLGAKLIAPMVIVLIGLSIIFRKPIVLHHKEGNTGVFAANNGDHYFAVFGGNTPRFDNSDFRGATAYAIFGNVELKLREAAIKRDCAITVYSIFGGTDIYLPSNLRTIVRSTPVFGSVSNRYVSSKENVPTVYIRAISIFGGTEIN